MLVVLMCGRSKALEGDDSPLLLPNEPILRLSFDRSLGRLLGAMIVLLLLLSSLSCTVTGVIGSSSEKLLTPNVVSLMDTVGVSIMLSEAIKNVVDAADITFGLGLVLLCFRCCGDSEDEPPPTGGRIPICF